jgi:hypothetical protein
MNVLWNGVSTPHQTEQRATRSKTKAIRAHTPSYMGDKPKSDPHLKSLEKIAKSIDRRRNRKKPTGKHSEQEGNLASSGNQTPKPSEPPNYREILLDVKQKRAGAGAGPAPGGLAVVSEEVSNSNAVPRTSDTATESGETRPTNSSPQANVDEPNN